MIGSPRKQLAVILAAPFTRTTCAGARTGSKSAGTKNQSRRSNRHQDLDQQDFAHQDREARAGVHVPLLVRSVHRRAARHAAGGWPAKQILPALEPAVSPEDGVDHLWRCTVAGGIDGAHGGSRRWWN